MPHELAKQLKDAGFPNISFDGCTYHGEGVVMDIDKCLCKHPTLEEFIEACGEDFSALYKENGGWQANSRYRVIEGVAGQEQWHGSTPNIAVARLWLVLNNK